MDDIERIYQLFAGPFESDEHIIISGIYKVHLKFDCIFGSIVNGAREPFLYSLALSSPSGHKIYKERRIKRLKMMSKSLSSHFISEMTIIKQ